jgi:hypothetical protein
MRISIVLILFSLSISAAIVDKCGIYKAEGEFQNIKGKNYFLIHPGTDHQIKVLLEDGEFQTKKVEKYKASVHLKIKEKCSFQCNGEVVKLLKLHPPTFSTSSFFPKDNYLKSCK